MDDLLHSHFSLFWTKTQIAECHKRGLNKIETIQYMSELAEFVGSVLVELEIREGGKKEVIEQ